MEAVGVIIFLPREGSGPSLMLEDILFDPAAAWLAARIPLWAFPPAVLATALDTLLTARLLRRTGDPNSLRWYARLPRRRPA